MARFERPSDRQDVRRAAPVHLKGKPYYGVNEHFPPEVLKIHRDALPIHKEARKRKLKSVFKRDKLYIEGELCDKQGQRKAWRIPSPKIRPCDLENQ